MSLYGRYWTFFVKFYDSESFEQINEINLLQCFDIVDIFLHNIYGLTIFSYISDFTV